MMTNGDGASTKMTHSLAWMYIVRYLEIEIRLFSKMTASSIISQADHFSILNLESMMRKSIE